MPLSFSTESNSQYIFYIITDPSTTTKAAFSDEWSSQTVKTDTWDREKRVL